MKTKLRKSAVIILLLLAIPFWTLSQTQEATIFDESTIVYRNSIYGGGILHTNGWGGHITFGKGKTAFKSRIYQFDVVGMKHPKEVRSYSPYTDETRSYIFGKLNNFFIIRPTFGYRTTLFDKIRKSGVAIAYTWRVGPSLGFTKPVYLEIGQFQSQARPVVVVVEKYDPEKHGADEIFGRAGGLRGFDELKIHPGLHGALALNFEYDQERSGLKGIEVGATVDYYPIEEIEIMAFAENYNLFFNFYVCLQFGKKFNK